ALEVCVFTAFIFSFFFFFFFFFFFVQKNAFGLFGIIFFLVLGFPSKLRLLFFTILPLLRYVHPHPYLAPGWFEQELGSRGSLDFLTSVIPGKVSFSKSSGITSIWSLGLHHPFRLKEPKLDVHREASHLSPAGLQISSRE
uniref:Uncharacterized protein n=1 Tax=Sus scrofa TaxID=9823 RepID=A0A8W4F9R8_PIG